MEANNRGLIANERAIVSKEEDLLNFYPFAEKVQKVIQGYSNNPEPLTIGIYGKWGTGKTSFLNLVKKHIELFQKDKREKDKPYIRFDYNPWIYQNKEEMLFDFFESLYRKLVYSRDSNLVKAGKFIKKYSRYLKAVKLSTTVGIPKIFNKGVTIEPYEILKRLGEDLEGEEKSLDELKSQIDNVLEESDKKIVIFIDDVDRLDKDEIFTLFKLIKVNADFKNLIFIICLDDGYVAKAIYKRYGKNKKAGKDFIEKIINIPIELPLIEDFDLDNFLKQKVKDVFKNKSKDINYKQADYEELLASLRVKYFDSPREIIRIVNSFAVSFYAIGDEVNIHDLFWIEYLKIKYNEVYKKIKAYAKDIHPNLYFTHAINLNPITGQDGLRKKIEEKHNKSFFVIENLFPIKKDLTISAFQSPVIKPLSILDKELRINHPNHFEKYFSFHTKGKISEYQFSMFKEKIKESDSISALEILDKLITDSGDAKILYKLKSDIELIEEENLNNYVNFLVDNIQEFSSMTNNSYTTELVAELAERLKQKPKENKILVLKVTDKLNVEQLSFFIGRFRYKTDIGYLSELEEKLIAKVKEADTHPFFKNKPISKLILEVWAKIDADELEEYVLQYFDNKENVLAFFKVFPNLWNGKINGMFKQEDFKYVTETLNLNSEKLLNKAEEYFPEIKDIYKLENKLNRWDEYSNNSGLDNLKQFAILHYENWYLNL